MVEILDQSTVSALVQAAGLAVIAAISQSINKRLDRDKADTEAKRAKEAEWRDEVDRKLSELAASLNDVDDKVNRSTAVQAANIRADIIHKCHRYLDDLGCASTEEKNALADEHKQYQQFCKDLEIDNDFIDVLVDSVMHLPSREFQRR